MADGNAWDSLSRISQAMKKNMREYEKTGTVPWTASTAMVDLAYQAGSLLKLKMQLDGDRHLQGQTPEQLVAQIEIELAEVVAISTFVAAELGLDLTRGFESMLAEDQEKIRTRALQPL